jgi:hypothetical protein
VVVCGIYTLLNSSHVKNNGARGLEVGDPSIIFPLFIITSSNIFILSKDIGVLVCNLVFINYCIIY